ncbi:MAG: FIVAR domain-containing protein [Propionibacteriaceae bacterium]|nr:FIVAR domain-containing protein [Propionibacteriaceae bacterium]
MQKSRIAAAVTALPVIALLMSSMPAAWAYSPTSATIYQLPSSQACLKGRSNCAIYPKSAQLPSGRLVMSFEKATVVAATQSADGETLPIYVSDNNGDSWQQISEVAAPAYLSSDPRFAPYVSNWTNPYLYVLPEDIGELQAGTLLLASVVSGDDYFYKERKAANPSFTPSSDGDRSDMAIALFASHDEGVTWEVLNVVATGGWQGGSAGATGTNVAAANIYRQIDPLWEPFLMVHDGKLICYYSDENDYIGYDPATGIPILDPDNDTAVDSRGQILVHKTWDGRSADWSAPVVDVAGKLDDMGQGKTEIGGGRPGMTTVVPTTDKKWLVTFEYWGGGANTRYKIADDPLRFFADGDPDGLAITDLPNLGGTLAVGGSPVTINLPDGRLVYNASGSGDVWVNDTGLSTGTWARFKTSLGSGYSRTLQYVAGEGRILILRNQGTSTLVRAHVDLGYSTGTYYQLVNRLTGQVLGTGNHSNDAPYGNSDVPDVVSEPAGSAADPATQYWHVLTKPNGTVTLLNMSGGRAAAIWTGSPSVGQKIGQWVDDGANGTWNVIQESDGYVKFQVASNTSRYLSGAIADAQVTIQNEADDGSQEWALVEYTTPPLNKTALQDLVDSAGSLVQQEYTASSWTALQTDLAAASQLLADPDTTQRLINRAAAVLQIALDRLVPTSAPELALRLVVQSAEQLEASNAAFTPESWKAVAETLAAAKQLLESAPVADPEARAATAAINAAIAALQLNPDRSAESALREIVAAAEALSSLKSTYSPDSWAALATAVANGRNLLKSTPVSESDARTATSEINTAIAGLKIATPVVAKVKLNQSQLRLVKGKSFTIEEGVYYQGGLQAAYSGRVTWKSSNPKIATVSSAGKIKAKKTGTVTITASATQANAAGKKLTVSIKVTVVSKKPKSKVTKVTASVPKTMSVGQVLYITGKYSSAKATGVKVTYSTSKPGIVDVDKVGRLVAKAKGTDYVKVKAGGKTATYKVTVK